jgi:hypothetical protein
MTDAHRTTKSAECEKKLSPLIYFVCKIYYACKIVYYAGKIAVGWPFEQVGAVIALGFKKRTERGTWATGFKSVQF